MPTTRYWTKGPRTSNKAALQGSNIEQYSGVNCVTLRLGKRRSTSYETDSF